MRNKFKLLAAALAAVMLFSGCERTPVRIEIDPNGVISSSKSSHTYSSSGLESSSFSGDPSGSGSLSESSSSSSPSDSGGSSSSGESSGLSSSSSSDSPSSSSTASGTGSSSGSSVSSSSTVIEPVIPDDPVKSRIAQMSLREKVYQMFFVKPEQITGSKRSVVTPLDLTSKPVGGIICMGENLQSVAQTKNMLSETQKSASSNGIGVFFGVDEEGGRVARCALKLGTSGFDGMAVYGERNDYDEAFHIGKTIGADIAALGFNVDFAPVADVDIFPNNELGDRIFSSDPKVVANMVSGVVRGLNASGVAATLKHFPGLGAEDGNTHTDTATVIDRTLEQLRNEEFVPFRSGILAGADFVMVGHQQVSSFGDGMPADLSYIAVTELLRGELGFNGIAITDAQVMNTISNVYSSPEAAVLSVKAGIDMILSPENLDEAVNGVYNAVLSGEISESRIDESVTRILTLKQELGLLKP